MRSIRRLLAPAALTLALCLAAVRPAPAADDTDAFVTEYRAWAVAVLTAVHADTTHDQDRRATFAVHEDPTKYVRCTFLAADTRIRCDASSGYYTAPAGQPRKYRLGKDLRDALYALGFDLDDSEGDFQTFIPMTGADDIATAADVALRTLHDIYGATNIDVDAPIAPPQVQPLAPAK
ncbi:MAG: hypothetical protein WDM94_11150 [Bauldia sp.]